MPTVGPEYPEWVESGHSPRLLKLALGGIVSIFVRAVLDGTHMNTTLKCLLVASAFVTAMPALADPAPAADIALTRYCEPLLAGTAAAQLTRAAEADGFEPVQLNGRPFLVQGHLILSVSDSPRVCIVQAPSGMTFAQGISLVDGWGARHTGALQAAATNGPDGAPVRMWIVPSDNKSLLVSEQTNPLGQKVLAFIMARFPGG